MSGTEATTSGTSTTTGYVHPEVLVETSWVAEHLNDPDLRLIEADENVLVYEVGHLPGAVNLDWHVDVQDPVSRDFIDQQGFEKLMSHWGIGNDKRLSYMAIPTTGLPAMHSGCSQCTVRRI